MEQQVIFHANAQGVYSDHNNMQNYVRQTFDDLVYDAIKDTKAYAGLNTTKTNTAEVTVEPGRYYDNGAIYILSANQILDLFPNLPLTTKKIVALCVNGQTTDTDAQPRKFLTDTTTRATQVQTVNQLNLRQALIQTVVGVENAAPAKPIIPADLIPFAWVTLETAGVLSVEMDADYRLQSVFNNAIRLDTLEDWRKTIGQRLDTIGSDLTALNNKLTGVTYDRVVSELAADVARLKEANELETGHTSYGADRFLDETDSNTGDVNYLAKIEEGIRFSADGESESAISLFNPLNSDVIYSNGFLLPKYNDVLRIALEDYAQEISISQYTFQTVNYKQRTMSRRRIRYGSKKKVCTNSAWWRSGSYDPTQNIFTRAGDTWEVVSGDPSRNHQTIRLRQFWVDTYSESYWDRIVTSQSVNGSVVAQTFLNTQDSWMTQLDLPITQVDASGDVTVLITQTKHGKPDTDNVIQAVTLAQIDMKTYPEWTPVTLPATFLEAGQLYSIVLITGGNHYVAQTQGDNFGQGTFFSSTDGEFFQGDLTKDMMFRLYAAEFVNTRIEVELAALSLVGGIADIDILYDGVVPEGTDLIFEVQPSGGSWTPLDEVVSGNHILFGLPALCQFRAVFVGTKDLQAGIKLDTSRVNISRPRTTFTHISNAVTLGSATQSLRIKVLLEWYEELNHDLTCVIDDVTNTVNDLAPATVTDVELATLEGNEKRIMRTFEWTSAQLTLATSQFIIKMNGTTTSALQTFHVAERVFLAF